MRNHFNSPAHQTFGKGDNSLSYRPFCILSLNNWICVLKQGTKLNQVTRLSDIDFLANNAIYLKADQQ
ncbi:hypothetical protein [Vibrio vulnificus YJ016]|uniref:Uncharacterized protein n=1 Tax=Vibrio vulnificus (strain YJ016) TaxID=196600 RepID=Q7MNC1_VIBVY|nr:hypothetical protein [Vibrio vulnificus YJ016]